MLSRQGADSLYITTEPPDRNTQLSVVACHATVSRTHNPTMKILLVFAVSVTLARGSSTPPPTVECSSHVPLEGRSMLTNLLQVAGYSDTCVAAALDYCSSPQEDGQFASLMEVSVWARTQQKS